MGEAAKKLTQSITSELKRGPKDSSSYLKSTHTEEIVIALCGQIGSNIGLIADSLINELRNRYQYQCVQIKLSDFIKSYTDSDLNTRNQAKRIREGIKGGNFLRQKYGNGILAQLAIRDILIDRHKEADEEKADHHIFPTRRKCYIINSLKNPEELEVLKLVYGDMLYTIGIFSPVPLRVQNLDRIGIDNPTAYQFIDQDTGEDIAYGQKVEKAFINSDYFLRISDEDIQKVTPKIDRFLKLVFDDGIITPDTNETAMYQAYAASVNSACLSRQVGAAITDSNGELLAHGWNDVPKSNGGVYTNLDVKTADMRCYNFNGAECSNTRKKKQIIDNITDSLKEDSIISEDQIEAVETILKNNGINGLIEFARSIHAEMHAIIIGSQKTGDKMKGGKLFCTTYPCHNCARHIILAGIKEVYYIEPYKKSLCTELHSDAITENDTIGQDPNKVRILMYEGVAPNRYLRFFQMKDNRKEKCISVINRANIHPKHTMTLRAISQLEQIVATDLKDDFRLNEVE